MPSVAVLGPVVRRRRILPTGRLVLTLGIVAAAAGVGVLVGGRGVPAYSPLRQASVQALPGSVEYTLAPPPADFVPRIDPTEAVALVPGAQREKASVVLAVVREELWGRGELGPAWVVIARGVCIRGAKGELVADARDDDPNGLRCTDRWMWFVAVDATEGSILASVPAYDASMRWLPALAGGAP
jgi:hypothetical protein